MSSDPELQALDNELKLSEKNAQETKEELKKEVEKVTIPKKGLEERDLSVKDGAVKDVNIVFGDNTYQDFEITEYDWAGMVNPPKHRENTWRWDTNVIRKFDNGRWTTVVVEDLPDQPITVAEHETSYTTTKPLGPLITPKSILKKR